MGAERAPYQPKTGERCGCRPGVQRDNCPVCEGTGMRIDFQAIRAAEDVRAAVHAGNLRVGCTDSRMPRISLWMVTEDGGEPSPWWAISSWAAVKDASSDNALAGINVKQYAAVAATVADYRKWYKDTVGYDPMAETPPLPEAEFLTLCREYVEAEGK